MPAPTEALDCARIEANLILLLDGQSGPLRADAVSGHLADCAGCAALYAALREQIVLDRWAAPEHPSDAEGPDCDPGDLRGFAHLTRRLQAADFGAVGALLYEILKAEFLYDYGDDVKAAAEPIPDPARERIKGSDLVEELRDFADADEMDGEDLRALARRFEAPSVDHDRLDALIEGMRTVARLAPGLGPAAAYYQALAHIKARREAEAGAVLAPIAASGVQPLARFARITLATLPALLGGRPADAIPLLEACLAGDPSDVLVHFNLAKAHFLAAGERVTPAVETSVRAARAIDPGLVDQHLGHPRERRLRLALAASAARDQSSSVR